jgi:glycosyltransferase involved in cell wall biosynthesis
LSQKQEGHEVLVITLRNDEIIARQLVERGVPVEILFDDSQLPKYRITYLLTIILSTPRLFKIAKKVDPDIIHTWMYLADLFGGIVGLFQGKPVIWGIFSGSLDPRYYSRGTHFLIRICSWLSRKVPKAIVSCSAFGRRTHVEFGYPAKKTLFIPTGFEVHEKSNSLLSGGDIQGVAGEYFQQQRTAPFRVGMLARASIEKDHQLLVHASAELISAGSNIRLILAGGVGISSGTEIEETVLRLGIGESVDLLGRVENISQWFDSIDLFVLLSNSEGFPTVIGEAMSFGKACLVSDVGDARILLADSDQIVPPKDSKAVIAGLQRFYGKSESELNDIGERNRARVKKIFPKELMYRRYSEIYKTYHSGIKYK